jgi:hypothetical protein
MGLERGSLSLVSATDELLGRKSSDSGLESREWGRWDPSRWPRGTLYQQKLLLTSPTNGGLSDGRYSPLVKSLKDFFFVIQFYLQFLPVHSANCVKTYAVAFIERSSVTNRFKASCDFWGWRLIMMLFSTGGLFQNLLETSNICTKVTYKFNNSQFHEWENPSEVNNLLYCLKILAGSEIIQKLAQSSLQPPIFKIHFNIVFPSMPTSTNRSHLFMFYHKRNHYGLFMVSVYATWPSHLLRFDRCNNIWWRAQIIKFLNLKFCSGLKYCLRHSDHRHPSVYDPPITWQPVSYPYQTSGRTKTFTL